MKLNLGCGIDYKKGFTNVDINKDVKADVYHDLNKLPYPFEDSSVDYIYADDVLVHLTLSPIEFLLECKRILKPNGMLHLIYPNMFWWRLRLNYLFGNILWSNAYHPRHYQLLKPSWILIVLRMLEFYVEETRKTGGLTGFVFKNHMELRESIINLKCKKKEGGERKVIT